MTEKEDKKTDDLDFILSEIGEFGRFQKVNFALLAIPIVIAGVFGLTYVFTATPLEYR